jgi:hypothetical protein
MVDGDCGRVEVMEFDWELAKKILADCERIIPTEERKPIFKIRPVTGGLAYENREYFRIDDLIKQISKNHIKQMAKNIDPDAWTDYAVYAAYKMGLLYPKDAAVAKGAFSDEPGTDKVTQVYGLYVGCDTPEKIQTRSREIQSGGLRPLDDGFKVFYELHDFYLEKMQGQLWVNVNTYKMIEVDLVDSRSELYPERKNAYYEESDIEGAGIDSMTIWRELDGVFFPCVEHWVRADNISKEKQLAFMLARYKELNRVPVNKFHWLSPDRFDEADNLWNEIKWFCHTNNLMLPQRPGRAGEQISMF